VRRVVVAGLLAAVYMSGQIHKVDIVDRGQPYVRTYREATNGLRGAMAAGDGQAYLALAQDPTMTRPGVFVLGRNGAVYRYQLPLLGYLSWAASLGRPNWEPGARAVIVVLGTAVAIGGCAELLRRRRREPLLALVVLAAPGFCRRCRD
jgi:hypothetical protein